jgi:hypothetical protein
VTNAGGFAGDTHVNLRRREAFGAAIWNQDSAQNAEGWIWTIYRDNPPNWFVGSPVRVFVAPEPSVLGLGALVGVGMIARRKR